MKEVLAPHLGRTVKFGRKRPVAIGPHFKLKNYLRATLPAAPTTADFAAKATASLSQVYLNDQLGDCVIAGGYHIVGVETGNASGSPFLATDQQLIADYSKIGGYVPGDPSTDNGCEEPVALNYWQQSGFADGTKLLGWLAVDATNKAEVMAALWLFENLMFAVELPDAWINPFPSAPGFTWGVAGSTDPQNGHCVVGVGYDANGVQVSTWGMIGTITWDAIAQYCTSNVGGGLYVMLTPDQLAKASDPTTGKAPNGVSWGDLVADFDAMGGHVPQPTPAPPAPPAPPPGTVTQTQVQQAVNGAFAHAPFFMTRFMAQNIADKAIATLPLPK